jgi:predicted peptidase
VGVLGRLRRTTAALLVLAGCKSDAGREQLADQMIAGRIGDPAAAYELVYRLRVPPALDPARKYPLVVFLHGSGALGSDNRRQVGAELTHLDSRLQAREPVFVLAPQCPAVDKWITKAQTGPHRNYSQSDRPESDAIKLVLKLLDQLERSYPIDPDRIYVTGHSSGAAGTWDIVTRHAGYRFAAAVPVTGTNDPTRASTIATLPVWAFHGAKDETSPVENSREMVAALRTLGAPVRYTEYADLGHHTLDRAYREPELVSWLLAQRRPKR